VGNRGRVSSAALTIAPAKSIDAVQRLSAPGDLTDEESVEWVAIVNTEPADKFAPSHIPLLASYCRHIVRARKWAELERRLDADKSATLDDFAKVYAVAARESSVMCILATKLNLTPKAISNFRGNKKPIPAQTPWD
jgi:hypothetical protein